MHPLEPTGWPSWVHGEGSQWLATSQPRGGWQAAAAINSKGKLSN